MNLTTGWNDFWNTLTGGNGLGTVLAIVGVAIIVFFIAMYAWQKRRSGGGGGGGFPVMAVVLGLLLAGPALVMPVILSLLEALFQIVVNIIAVFAGML